MALTPKQQRFIEEYLVDLNATQAAVRAGYSEKTAEAIGHENLRKPQIQEKVSAAIRERAERTGITQERVVEELGKVAFQEASDASSSELKYSSKLKALELLGKHLGMFEGKKGQEESGVGGVIVLSAVEGLEDD